jgi:hypothetical protein
MGVAPQSVQSDDEVPLNKNFDFGWIGSKCDTYFDSEDCWWKC